MTLPRLFSLCLALPLAATCADFETEPPRVESSSEAIKGGDVVTGNAFTGTARLQITRPPDDQGMPRDPLDCSGALVAPRLVLTSAICVADNLDGDTFVGTITTSFGAGGNEPAGGIAAIDVELHRYFDENNNGVAQLAIVELAEDAPISATVVTPNDQTLDGATIAGGMITIVGYGGSDDNDTGLGSRNGVQLPLGALTNEFFNAGDADNTSCNGDGGAPVFADVGAGPVLIGITQFQSRCADNHPRTRVDKHVADFIFRYVDQKSGPCLVDGSCVMTGCRTPDPDCAGNECEWGNACEEDCPTRDWDCPLGSFAGEVCENSGDCEENGGCIPAVDDASFLYCNKPCDSAQTVTQCPVNMTCENNSCVYGNPSPGSQGFDCLLGEECRSGICEDRICVNTCDPAANDCPGEFTCGPSKVQPGTNVCLGQDLSGGGGFCNASSGAPAGGALVVLMALALIGARRRRRS